jgi:hypothetical protein
MSLIATLETLRDYTASLALRSVYTASLEILEPQMSNYLINRYDLTGLYGGTSVDLDGIAESTLDGWANGTRLQVGFAGRIVAQYVIRANTGAETDTAASGRIVVFDNDTARVAELEFVVKEGLPCAWDEESQTWCQVTGYGGAASLITPGFTIPA